VEDNVGKVLGRAKRNYDTKRVRGVHCLDWQGAKNSDGYPVMNLKGRGVVLVTRYILWKFVRGFQPKEEACHHCDRPPCIEPRHLHHGFKARNMRDMWSRKRRTKPNTFIAEKRDATKIRRKANAGDAPSYEKRDAFRRRVEKRRDTD
jgi:hypothetical protein